MPAETTGSTQHNSQHQHTHTHGPMAKLVFIGYHLHQDLVVAKLSEYTGDSMALSSPSLKGLEFLGVL